MESWRDFIRHYLIAGGIPIVLVLSGAISIVALLWQPGHEVMWSGSWIVHECGLPGAEGKASCVGQYELHFGNTGNETEHVQVQWPVDLHRWSVDTQTLNISADRPRLNDPDFSCEQSPGHVNCSIDKFAAGTLLIVSLRCLMCEPKDMEALAANPPAVSSEAKVYQSDPRATLLFRRLTAIFSLFL